MSHFCRTLCLASVALLSHFCPAYAQGDVFIDGLPDVPLLEVVESIDGEPVVFDAPSGTVAEFTLNLRVSPEEAIARYDDSLSELGWDCARKALIMTCRREENQLVFAPSGGNQSRKLILRLEPTE